MITLVKKYRHKRGITLRELSRLSGINISKISKIENNILDPRLGTIEKLGHALEVCPIILLGGCYEFLCTEQCSYYKDKYVEYNKLPVEGRLEVLYFIRYIKRKYRNYFLNKKL